MKGFSKNSFWAISVLVLAALAAYSNSFSGSFVYDDLRNISENTAVRQLWPQLSCQAPCSFHLTLWGQPSRPLLGFSFALNYAIGGLSVLGYHVVNLAIHLTNALLVFGILRRTFALPALRGRFGDNALVLTFAISLLWAVHPLQTESVTYIVQRAESLVSLFYLLTLYCLIRGAESGKPNWWYVGAVLACLLGMSTKEVMVTAPVVVLLYDGMFLAGSFREALRRRAWLYAGLALTWVWLAFLVMSAGELLRLGAGAEVRGVADRWTYAATQPSVILYYLRLTLWPSPLVLDYQWPAAKSVADALPAALAIGVLLITTLWGLLTRRAWAFLGACFFLILSPSSSIVPLFDDYIFEHRMYLPLAAVLTLLVLTGYSGIKICTERGWIPGRATQKLGIGAVLIIATALGVLTFQRNKDYATELSIWQDTVLKAPGNPRAHNNFGFRLAEFGRTKEAIAHYNAALRLKSDYADAQNNLGNALAEVGQKEEAAFYFRKALTLKPEYPVAHNNLGNLLAGQGNVVEAIRHYREALRLKPDFYQAHNNLGVAFAGAGRIEEAIAHYREALRLKPNFVDALNNFGIALAGLGQKEEAIRTFRKVLALKPEYPVAQNNLGIALAKIGRNEEAIAHYRHAIKLRPNYAEAYENLGTALAETGETEEAIVYFKEVLNLVPESPYAHNNLGYLFARTGRRDDAIVHYREALKLKPDYVTAQVNLRNAMTQLPAAIRDVSSPTDKSQPRSSQR